MTALPRKTAVCPTVRAAAVPVPTAGRAAEAPTAPEVRAASVRKREAAISTSSAVSASGRSRRMRAMLS